MQSLNVFRSVQFIALFCAVLVLATLDSATTAETKPRTNRLGKETSPYLLLHAHNPVDWYPWGPEAFEKARKEDKLIFLSVGYSSCYWCHVMERNVFSNEAIAKTLNQNFVCIKVDREERPEIDDIYMTALQVYFQAIGSPSSGGWPLSIFLTPDGKPIGGGTYFPPEDGEGNQGFPTILAKLTDLWKNKREEMVGNADILAKETQRLMQPKLELKPAPVNDSLIEAVFSTMVASFDPEFGGIDFNVQHPDGPKFPTPCKLQFVQELVRRHPDEQVGGLVDLTLLQLACGGIRDHLGGGFHRYSIDRRWDVPHFEKMLYDQAQMADVFVKAYASNKRPLYKQVADELFAFVAREMTSPEGGFYSAIDAESGGVEGAFYVWDADEIDQVLGSDANKFKEVYTIKDLPDFEEGNVLRLSPRRLSKVLLQDNGPDVSDHDGFAASRQKLLEVRNHRKKPMRDEKILTGWNGLMIGAYARASRQFANPEYGQAAERAASFVLAKLRDPQGHLLRSYAGGQARIAAYLDDYAYLIDGLLALHELTDNPKWLKAAKQLQDDQLRSFLDENNGGFYFTSHQHEALLVRPKDCSDGVLPAANGVAARNLLKLAKRTGASAYQDEAQAAIESFGSNVERLPRLSTTLAFAALEFLDATRDNPKTSAAEAPNDRAIAQAKAEQPADKEPLVVLAGQNEERPKKDEHLKAKAYLSTDKLPAGSTCQYVVVLNVDPEWHVNANPPEPDNLIPVKVTLKSKLGVTTSAAKYPKGHKFTFKDDEDNPIMAYEGEFMVFGTLTIPEKLGGQTDEMEITIDFQACHEDGSCLPPKKIKLAARLAIAKKGEAVKQINSRLFAGGGKTAKSTDN